MKSSRTARRHFHSVGKHHMKVFMGNFSKLRRKTRVATKPVSSTKCVTESGNTNEREPMERGLRFGRRSQAKPGIARAPKPNNA